MTITPIRISAAPCDVRGHFLFHAVAESLGRRKGETKSPEAGEPDLAWSLMEWWLTKGNRGTRTPEMEVAWSVKPPALVKA